MALESRLELKLSQKLVLTPQLQQAIKLLQLPQLELSQTINNELIENPFLEDNIEEVPGNSEVQEEHMQDGIDHIDDTEIPVDNFSTMTIDDFFDERSSDGRDLGYFNPGVVEKPTFETFLSSETDLTDHLIWQLGLSQAEGKLKDIAEMVIGNLDENGYLHATDAELAELMEVDISLIKKAVSFVQTFDPPGVCARDIKECLLIQLRLLNLKDTLVEKIVQNNLHDLEKRKYRAIADRYSTPMEDVLIAVKVIEGLEPKPGRSFSNSRTSYAVTDVYVEKVDGEFRIVLNDDGLPKLRINSKYKEFLKDKKSYERSDKQFLIEKYRAAVWLLKSLDQRNKTIYKVTESILRTQEEFFERGVQYLKPLNLKDVATDINMHESNISRVTSNKYLSCNHGIFPFKFFFSGSVSGQKGDVSSASVKDLIKRIIEEEDSKNPLPDSRIVNILEGKNIKIARRTLAKYREEMKIPSHSKRKKLDF